MRPHRPETRSQSDLFRESLAAILNPRHELLVLASHVDWESLEERFGAIFVDDVSRPGLPTRLMAGLHLRKPTVRAVLRG